MKAICVVILVGAVSTLSAGAGSSDSAKPAPATAPTTARAATTPAGGTVSGRVTVSGGRPVPEMIVYLDPIDPKFAFDKPEKHFSVAQQDAKFAPGLLIVPVGATVEFSNDETKAVEHNVFSNSGAKKFDLGLYKPGKSSSVEFDKPGAVRLRCSIHRYMDGVVYVAPSPYFAIVAIKDGSFTMTGVKPGAYKLRTWQRTQRYKDQDMPVTAAVGKTVSVKIELAR